MQIWCNIYIKIKIDNIVILHHENHEPNTNFESHKFLDEDIISNIQQLYQTGISPIQIQSFLINNQLLFISQIQRIVQKEQIKELATQTNSLIQYMNSKGGFFQEKRFNPKKELKMWHF